MQGGFELGYQSEASRFVFAWRGEVLYFGLGVLNPQNPSKTLTKPQTLNHQAIPSTAGPPSPKVRERLAPRRL